jgi:hypothetical protein
MLSVASAAGFWISGPVGAVDTEAAPRSESYAFLSHPTRERDRPGGEALPTPAPPVILRVQVTGMAGPLPDKDESGDDAEGNFMVLV